MSDDFKPIEVTLPVAQEDIKYVRERVQARLTAAEAEAKQLKVVLQMLVQSCTHKQMSNGSKYSSSCADCGYTINYVD